MSAPVLWFLLGIAFFGTEMLAPACMLLFFGIGAWITALLSLFIPAMNAGVPPLIPAFGKQVFVFVISSVLTLIFLRRRLRSVFGGRRQTPVEEQDHPMIGRKGTVSKALHPGETGEISIDGSFWRAVSGEDISEGKTVRVLGALPADAIVLRVTTE